MRQRHLILAVLSMCLASVVALSAQETPPQVMVHQGSLQGTTSDGVRVFRGIPYAQPPVGSLRWKPPVPALPWAGVRDATEFGRQSVQPSPPWSPSAVAAGDEDCLYLNLSAPSAPGPWPVLVFLHGGSHITGTANNPHYDGRYLARHGPAVVITVEYRLGPMGNLALPALSAESPHHASGNYGLQDQILALQWIHDNVAAWGGDPARVLLFGQSSGANDVLALMTSPLAHGLFSRAMMMSGGLMIHTSLAAAEKRGERVTQALGTTDLASLRTMPAADVILHARETRTAGGLSYTPNVDGWVLPVTCEAALASHQFNAVPLMVGTTADEMADLLNEYGSFPHGIRTEADYRIAISSAYGSKRLDAILPHYPITLCPTPWDTFVALQTDQGFNTPNRHLLRLLSSASSAPIYRYVYQHTMDAGPRRPLGAAHAFDIPFVFHVMPSTATAREFQLADWFSREVVQFARTGNPNGNELPRWEPYDRSRDNYLAVDIEPYMAEPYRKPYCDLWDELLSP